ncbi:MAG: hypothetical protein C4542_09515 [Dehalococcoidia bacterium]|nr:MAG: hypothetical protein C4542_09515 [Dehalococcoidia bacterium]
MPNKILVQEMDGTPLQIVFADHAGDFNPAAATDLRKTSDGSQELDCQISLASLADAAARQSTKVDLGTNRAELYAVRAAFEIAATPTAGDLIELYWAPSPSGTAANANPGGVVGADSAYSGGGTLANGVRQLIHIGNFVCTAEATATVQVCEVGVFAPTERYGTLIVKNESNAAFHSDDVECHVVLDPIVPEIQ